MGHLRPVLLALRFKVLSRKSTYSCIVHHTLKGRMSHHRIGLHEMHKRLVIDAHLLRVTNHLGRNRLPLLRRLISDHPIKRDVLLFSIAFEFLPLRMRALLLDLLSRHRRLADVIEHPQDLLVASGVSALYFL